MPDLGEFLLLPFLVSDVTVHSSIYLDTIIRTIDDILYENDHIGICITYYFIDYRQCVYNHI